MTPRWIWFIDLFTFAALGAITGMLIELGVATLRLHWSIRIVIQLFINGVVIYLLERMMDERFTIALYNETSGSFFFILLLAFQPNFYSPVVKILLGHLYQ